MLTHNSFFVLGLSLRDNQDAITNAIEEKIASGAYEEIDLLHAQKSLMISKTRLEAEIAWFPDLSPKKSKKICDLLVEKNSTNQITSLKKLLKEINGVSKANLASYICINGNKDKEVLQTIISCQVEISLENLKLIINANRQIAGFPEVNNLLVSEQLNKRKQFWAEAAIQQIKKLGHPGYYMLKILQDIKEENLTTQRFVECILERYESLVTLNVRNHENKIHRLIADIRSEENNKTALIDKIIVELKLWHAYTRPSQFLFNKKGLDEPNSKIIFNLIHDLYVDLVTEDKQYEFSLLLAKTAKDIFSELPSIAHKIEEEMKDIEEIIIEEDMSSLNNLISDISEDDQLFINAINESGFSGKGIGVAKDLYDAFFAKCNEFQGTEHENRPWHSIHQLVINLINKRDNPESIKKIIDSLLNANPPEEIKEALQKDLHTLEENCLCEDLLKALKSKKHKSAKIILQKLINIAETEEKREKWIELSCKIHDQNDEKIWKIIKYIFIGFIILVVALSKNDIKKSKQSPRRTYSKDNEMNHVNSKLETPPPLDKSNQILDINQLRWCMYQAKRLVFIFSQFPSNENDKDPLLNYNTQLLNKEILGKIDMLRSDLKKRCLCEQSYLASSEKMIENELRDPAIQHQINESAKSIMKSWNINFVFKDLK